MKSTEITTIEQPNSSEKSVDFHYGARANFAGVIDHEAPEAVQLCPVCNSRMHNGIIGIYCPYENSLSHGAPRESRPADAESVAGTLSYDPKCFISTAELMAEFRKKIVESPAVVREVHSDWSRCETHGKYLSKVYKDGCPICLRPVKILAKTGIPEKFLTKAQQPINPIDEVQKSACGWLHRYIKAKSWGESLILSGVVGRGKTHILTRAVANAALNGHSAFYVREADLCRIVWGERHGNPEKDLANYESQELLTRDVLAIDEFGLSYGNQGNQAIIDEFVRRRHDRGLGVLIATNLTTDGLKKIHSAALVDRILENSTTLVFAGESLRKPKGL